MPQHVKVQVTGVVTVGTGRRKFWAQRLIGNNRRQEDFLTPRGSNGQGTHTWILPAGSLIEVCLEVTGQHGAVGVRGYGVVTEGESSLWHDEDEGGRHEVALRIDGLKRVEKDQADEIRVDAEVRLQIGRLVTQYGIDEVVRMAQDAAKSSMSLLS